MIMCGIYVRTIACMCVYLCICMYVCMYLLYLFIKHAPLLGVILHAIMNMLISLSGNAVNNIVAAVAAFPLEL
jgi:hypothetical protein